MYNLIKHDNQAIILTMTSLQLDPDLVHPPGGGTDPRKVRVGSPAAKQMKLSIFANLKKGGLSGRAYPYTFSMGVPPPPRGSSLRTSQKCASCQTFPLTSPDALSALWGHVWQLAHFCDVTGSDYWENCYIFPGTTLSQQVLLQVECVTSLIHGWLITNIPQEKALSKV